MGKLGFSYGSEWHLLRFMGRHRHLLDQRVLEVVGGDSIDWLDFDFEPKKKRWLDAEIKSLAFLPQGHQVQALWKQWWPQGRGIHNWDAVGRVGFGDAEEWLLIEAKANLEELCYDCGATSPTNRLKIERALAETKQALGVPEEHDWLNGYYQFCNRTAALYFLNHRGVPAHLLYIYFLGDHGDQRRTCPSDIAAWQEALQVQEECVGLPTGHWLEARMHKLFLPVAL